MLKNCVFVIVGQQMLKKFNGHIFREGLGSGSGDPDSQLYDYIYCL